MHWSYEATEPSNKAHKSQSVFGRIYTSAHLSFHHLLRSFETLGTFRKFVSSVFIWWVRSGLWRGPVRPLHHAALLPRGVTGSWGITEEVLANTLEKITWSLKRSIPKDHMKGRCQRSLRRITQKVQRHVRRWEGTREDNVNPPRWSGIL